MSLVRARQMLGYTVFSLEGDAGNVSDVLFDDRDWRVRFVAVKTGEWLDERVLLVAPESLAYVSDANRSIRIQLTKEQILASPKLDDMPPVYRQMALTDHPMVFPPVMFDSIGYHNAHVFLRPADEHKEGDARTNAPKNADLHLRSLNEVSGYSVLSNGDDVGSVQDAVVDDESWQLKYVIVKTGNWHVQRSTLAPVNWFGDIDWGDRRVDAFIDRDLLKSAPAYAKEAALDAEFEARVARHFRPDDSRRTFEVHGLPVFDVNSGRLYGAIDDVLLEPGLMQLAGITVTKGSMLSRTSRQFPVSLVRVKGEDAWFGEFDAATFTTAEQEALDSAQSVSLLRGRHVVSEGGTPLADVGDVQFRPDGSISGFSLQKILVGGPLRGAQFLPRTALQAPPTNPMQPLVAILAVAESVTRH